MIDRDLVRERGVGRDKQTDRMRQIGKGGERERERERERDRDAVYKHIYIYI